MAESGCMRDGEFNSLLVSGSIKYMRNIIPLTNATTTNRTLTVAESGSLITLDPNTNTATTINITLPSTNQVGSFYEFYFLTNPQHNDADVTINTGNNSINFAGNFIFADARNPDGNANFFENILIDESISKLTIDATNLKQTIDATIKLTSVSATQWRIESIFPNIGTPHADNLSNSANTDVQIVTSATI